VWDAETMDLPVVKYREQKRPTLTAGSVSQVIADSEGQERVLYVLLAATGMRISEALALETRHFINDGHTIKVEQQVEKDAPLVAKYLKSDAAYREIDLHSAIAEFLRQYATGKSGLLFRTRRNTPHLYANLEDRWLTPRLIRMRLEEEGMGWHSFRRFRKTWLRGRRCLEDINNSGWPTSQKRCQKSIPIFTRNSNCVSKRPSEWSTASTFRRPLLLQMLQKNA
jgi:integrase